MSWQAQTAVNHHSTQRNMDLFRLLLYLAELADEAGRIDPAPRQDTMASFFDCTARTIRNRISRLIDSGELAQVRVGTGAGNASAYLIQLPFDSDNEVSKTGNNEESMAALAQRVALIEEKLTDIMRMVAQIKPERKPEKPEKPERKTGKTGKKNRKGHSCKSAHDPIRSIFDPKEREGNGKPERKPEKPETAHSLPFWKHMPDELKTDGMVQAWADWLQYCNEADLRFTPTQARITLDKLAALTPEVAQRAITLSLERGWKNIYPEAVTAENGKVAEIETTGGFY